MAVQAVVGGDVQRDKTAEPADDAGEVECEQQPRQRADAQRRLPRTGRGRCASAGGVGGRGDVADGSVVAQTLGADAAVAMRRSEVADMELQLFREDVVFGNGMNA